MGVQDTVSVTVRRGAESWQFFAFIFAAFYALVVTIFDEWKCSFLAKAWVRIGIKLLVFVCLFLLIMKSTRFHNILVSFLNWLVTEQH